MLDQPAGELASEALAAYQLGAAQRLTDDAELREAAVLFVDVDTLLNRIVTAEETHEAHAAAAIKHAEQIQAEADRIIERERDEIQSTADAEAGETARAARRSRNAAELQRATALADRLEQYGEEIRLEKGRAYKTAGLAHFLRAGDISPERVAAIAAMLERAA